MELKKKTDCKEKQMNSAIYTWIIQPQGSKSQTNLTIEVKVAQLCPTLCNPMDYTVPGILQARILEWVVIPFSRGSSQPRDQTQVSHIAGGT